jgi:hypothetical protein
LSLDIKTVSRGGVFSTGKSVAFTFDGKYNEHKLSWVGGRSTVQGTAALVIFVFEALYVIAFVQAYYGLAR